MDNENSTVIRRVDSFGRVMLPKSFREAMLGPVSADRPVKITLTDANTILIEKLPPEILK